MRFPGGSELAREEAGTSKYIPQAGILPSRASSLPQGPIEPGIPTGLQATIEVSHRVCIPLTFTDKPAKPPYPGGNDSGARRCSPAPTRY